jgi:biofilm protein TabA
LVFGSNPKVFIFVPFGVFCGQSFELFRLKRGLRQRKHGNESDFALPFFRVSAISSGSKKRDPGVQLLSCGVQAHGDSGRMAIFGLFSTVRAQAFDPRFAAAHEYVTDLLTAGSVANQRIHGMGVGVTERIELAGGAFALEQVYQSRARSDAFFESHRKYIDVQVIVAGIEKMEVEDIGRLTVDQPYLEARDLIKYLDTATASQLAMTAGQVAVFFPVDGHISIQQPAAGQVVVRKSVVKVPVG